MSQPALSDYRGMIRAYLGDSEAVVYDNSTIDQGLRMALDGLSRAVGAGLAVEDLDGAEATTVQAGDTSILVTGAAGYAVSARCVGLTAQHTLGDRVPPTLPQSARDYLAAFAAGLEAIRLRTLQTATDVPYQELEYEE